MTPSRVSLESTTTNKSPQPASGQDGFTEVASFLQSSPLLNTTHSLPAVAPSESRCANEHAWLHLVNQGESRPDLAKRREVKYLLPQADVGKLRTLLSMNCRRLIHNEQVSTVRSIYFDDARLSACFANLAGVGERQKLRLRWYDQLMPQFDFFVEVKWRQNQVTGKHRMQMQADKPLYRVPYRQLFAALIDKVPRRLVPFVLNAYEPIVVVQYHREHFAWNDDIRFTIDYDFTFYDQTGKRSLNTSFARRLPGTVVLEGKTPVGRERELRAALHPFTPRMGSCSKYVLGCRALGLVPDGETVPC